jgi:hypothetical protein
MFGQWLQRRLVFGTSSPVHWRERAEAMAILAAGDVALANSPFRLVTDFERL